MWKNLGITLITPWYYRFFREFWAAQIKKTMVSHQFLCFLTQCFIKIYLIIWDHLN